MQHWMWIHYGLNTENNYFFELLRFLLKFILSGYTRSRLNLDQTNQAERFDGYRQTL